MRVTQNQFFDLALRATRKHSRIALRSQEQIASGQRILRPSDDPTAARRILSLEASLVRNTEYSENLENARRFLDTGAEALTGVTNLLSQVREAAIAGSNGTLTQIDRDTFAQQIDALREQLVGLANSQFQGQFLFAGTDNTESPFVLSSGSVDYRGNDDTINAAVAPGLETALNISGSDIFLQRTALSPRFLGDTGVAAGSTPSSLRVDTLLEIEKTLTTVGDGSLPGGGDSVSGIVPGASTSSDTILGDHSVRIEVNGDGTGGTISLDDGPARAFSTTDTDFRLEDEDGNAVYLDLSGVSAGFTGDVSLSAEGTYSLDGGTTTTAIDFGDADQAITDPASGKVVYVNSQGVTRAGDAQLLYTGGLDLFQTVGARRDDLLNEDGIPSDEISGRVLAHLEELDRHLNGVLNKLSELGSRSSSLETISSFLDQQDLGLRDTLSSLKDTDISESVIELVRAQGLLDAAAAVSNQVLSNSLSSFLG